jgi:type IX secretion system PorP/SprF family membrane protein
MKKYISLLVGILVFAEAFSQDPQFTQFFAAPLYHNPAFAGGNYAPRVMFNYRNQWPSLNANFITTMASIDHFIEKANSGVGITVMNDQQGNRLKNTEISGLYSYQVKLTEKNSLRLGLQGTYSNRGFDPNGLTFGDQFNNNGFISGSTSKDPFATGSNYQKVNLFDVASGVLFYNPKSFIGLSAHHITQPAISYLKTANNSQTGNRLSRKYMLTGGLNIPVNNPLSNGGAFDKELIVTPTFLYKKQGAFSQLDLGAYITYAPLSLGLWYRGIPLKKVFKDFPNQDAVAALIGFRFDSFSIGYSYDLTISGLGTSSGGSHEISISYQLQNSERDKTPYLKQRKKELSCPRF